MARPSDAFPACRFTDEMIFVGELIKSPGSERRVAASEIDQSRLILLEDGRSLRDQALACPSIARG